MIASLRSHRHLPPEVNCAPERVRAGDRSPRSQSLNADRPHILLRGLTEPLDGYQYFPLVLTFERAGWMEIEVYVEEPN
jgi:hypothetical protein